MAQAKIYSLNLIVKKASIIIYYPAKFLSNRFSCQIGLILIDTSNRFFHFVFTQFYKLLFLRNLKNEDYAVTVI